MELKKTDYLVQVYTDIFGERPTNICSFFWGTVWFFANFLTSVIGIIQIFWSQYEYNKLENKNQYDFYMIIGLTYLERVFQIMFWAMTLSNPNLVTSNYILIDYIVFTILVYIIIGILLRIAAFIFWISEKVKKRFFKTDDSVEKSNLVVSYLKGVKNKYCELITYK
jgi:hypothetical protein